MKTEKQLGIYLDHTNAFLMELINKMIVSKSIQSNSKEEEKKEDDEQNPHFMLLHCTEKQYLKSAYYEEISEDIRNYQQVVLFGPSDAKNELFNLLEYDHLTKNIKIELGDSKKMNDNQMHDFVKEYFK